MAAERIRVVVEGDSSDLRRALREAREELQRTKRSGGDAKLGVDTAGAMAKLKALRAQIADLERERVNIRADADTGVAAAKLKILRAEAERTENALAMHDLRSRGLLTMSREADHAGARLARLGDGLARFGSVARGAGAAMSLLKFPAMAAGIGVAGGAIGRGRGTLRPRLLADGAGGARHVGAARRHRHEAR